MMEENMGFSVLYNDVCERSVKDGRIKKIPIEDMSLEHEFNAVWTKGSIYGEEYKEILSHIAL
jgi:hypothetical protein